MFTYLQRQFFGLLSQFFIPADSGKRILCALIFLISFVLNAQHQRHVVLVIIDGARYSETLGEPAGRYVPRMWELAKQGVVIDSMMNDGITVTKQALPALWCGSWAVPRDTVINGAATQYTTVPSVWEYFRKSRGVDSTHAMYIKKYSNAPWLQSFSDGYGPSFWPWYIMEGTTDLEVWQNAQGKLQTYHPELAVIYLPDVDAAAARLGWLAYTQAIGIADSIVGMLWDFLQKDPVYKNTTTLLVTNDHGRHSDGVLTGFSRHGDGCIGCRHIQFLAVGDGIVSGKHTTLRRTSCDVTATIGALLQFPTPDATGTIMTEIFSQTGTVSTGTLAVSEFQLSQNYPNPFNPSTTIRYALPSSGHVKLTIHDVLGREAAALVNEVQSAGWKEVEWNASGFASGMYLVKMQAGSFVESKKILLMK